MPDTPRFDEQHLEALIDEALQETFPASDPPAPFHPEPAVIRTCNGQDGAAR